jgi:acetyl esterase/lipase
MHGGLALLMDIHHPPKRNGVGIVVIPGSGWQRPLAYDAEPLKESRDLESYLPCENLRSQGYTLFVINHRATPVFRYPAPVDDAQRAVRFIRYHAKRFNIDPTRIGSMGISSGGYLASMLGVLDGTGNEEDPSEINRLSAKVQAVVAIATPADFVQWAKDRQGDQSAWPTFLGVFLPGWVPRDMMHEEYRRCERASPVRYVTADDPPFLLIHGENDRVVPLSQGESLARKLKDSKVEVKLVTIADGNHVLAPAWGQPSKKDEYYPIVLDFFQRYLAETARTKR